MRKNLWKKLFASSLIAFLLFWTAVPSIMLATFITPGTPIAPGTAIKPGDPISGGQFIAPGEVLTPGDSYLPGQPGYGNIPSVSGQPIIPGTTITNGIFITPNYISAPYSGWQLGTPITGGQGPDGGQGGSGDSGTGGTPGTGGQGGSGDSGTGGTPGTGGQGGTGDAGTGGTPGSGGQGGTGDAGTGGTPGSGGQGGTGDSGTGGTPGSGGQGGTGDSGTGGTPGTSGQGGSGGGGGGGGVGSDSGTASESQSDGPSNMNVVFKSTDGERGILGQITGAIRDVKSYWFGFGDKVVGPLVAWNAGFDFKTIESGRLQGNIAITGKDSVKNPILNQYFQKFKEYKINGEPRKLGNGARQVSPDKIDAFNQSRKIASPGETGKSAFQLAKDAAKSSVDDAINIKTSSFWSLKNIAKLNGPVNVILSSANSLIDYSGAGKNASTGYASTDFAADLTTDVAVGVGITALSSLAGSVAAGAVVGTAIPIPIVGTLVGAGVGLLVGVGASLLINTEWGRAAKKFVRDGVKSVYDGAVHAAKGVWNAGSDFVGSLFG